MLSAEQIAHFETFGFLVLRQLFTADEMSIMRREAGEIFEEDRGSTPVAETESIVQFFERKPYLSGLVDDNRVYNIGLDLLGPDFILQATSGTRLVGDTRWHADLTFDNPLRSANVAFYTERLTRETGSLRVIPGSHRAGSPDLLAPLRSSDGDPDSVPFGVPPSELPCYSYESDPGDVIVFQAQLLHASFGSQVARHMHVIAFLGDPRTAEETTAFHTLYEKAKYSLHPAESYVNSDSSRIRAMVSRLVEWGFETSKV